MRNPNTIPLYTATKSLDVNYHFEHCIFEKADITVEGAYTHAVLRAGYEGLIETRNAMYTSSIENINIATIALTFLYTDTNTEEGYLGEEIYQQTYHVGSSNYNDCRIISSMNLYGDNNNESYFQRGVTTNKSLRNTCFNQLLEKRINAFSAIKGHYDFSEHTIYDTDKLVSTINGSMFHETFHHSEQASMHWLSRPAGIQTLVSTLLAANASYVYGVVLDIYTQRMMCCNCNACLLGMQNSKEAGFLFDLSSALEKNRIEPRMGSGLMLHSRVSASQGLKSTSGRLDALHLPSDQNKIHFYDHDQRQEVFQAENKTLGTTAIIRNNCLSLKSYNGSFFVSKNFPDSKLEQKIKLNP